MRTFAANHNVFSTSVGSLIAQTQGISAESSLKCLFRKKPQGYFFTSQKIFYEQLKYIMKEKILLLKVSLCVAFKTPKLIRVKAHTRIRNGQKEAVRSHYRCVEER